MRSRLNSIARTIAAWALILSMGLLIANKAVFFHVHKMVDGSLVTHAHPFDRSSDPSPYKTHQHNAVDWLLLAAFDNIIAVGAMCFVFIILLLVIIRRIHIQLPHSLVRKQARSGRAPPLF